jgi:hypothetical protein
MPIADRAYEGDWFRQALSGIDRMCPWPLTEFDQHLASDGGSSTLKRFDRHVAVVRREQTELR